MPTPLAQTAGFSAIGGFGRGALGPLPAGYPAPASRFVLRDLRLLLQLCGPLDEALAAPGEQRLGLLLRCLRTGRVQYAGFSSLSTPQCAEMSPRKAWVC